MKKLWIKAVSLLLSVLFICTQLSACGIKIMHFYDWCKTSEDGFYYYYNDNSDRGAYILDIPDTEELIIPEYIDGKKVVELGYWYMGIGYGDTRLYDIYGKNTKKLTIQHEVNLHQDQNNVYVSFPNLTHLTFIDFLYCNQRFSEEELMVPHYIGARSSNVPRVELKNSGREFSLEEFKPKTILIPEYVEVIEAGVFDGLTDVTIKTSFESKPEGWEEGWNGDCEVIWGEEITYLYYYDWIKTNEDGFKYYYDAKKNEGVYILGISDKKEITIPEYINGNKVVKLGHTFKGENYAKDYYFECTSTTKLTIQHEFSVTEGTAPDSSRQYVSFPNLTELIFMDFLYCNLFSTKRTLVIPCYIGEDNNNVSSVELRKSGREYSLENFNPKVIVIPEYVTVIEAGVFDGLTDVVIKTSYESKPEGWEDGWNGDCEVIWEAQFN